MTIISKYIYCDLSLFLKALHIIGFVSWFAGIFYIVRLFVYHREAWDKGDKASVILRKQYEIMESRLMNIIQTPAMIMTLAGGIGMLIISPARLSQYWMHLKLVLVAVLILYHFSCIRHMKKLRSSSTDTSGFSYRLCNELSTLILVAIVMLSVWKKLEELWLMLVFLLLGLGIVFFVMAKVYKRKRED